MKSIQSVIGKIVQKVGERTCEECGHTVPIYERNGEQSSLCLNCDNQRIKSQAESYRAARHKQRINELISQYEVIPEEIKGATFEGYQPSTQTQRQALTISKKFANGELEEKTLFFQGTPGIGKTHLSYSIANSFKEQGYSVLFIDLPSLMTIIRGTYNRNSNLSQEQFMQLIQKIELLILDDVGAEYVKQDPNGLESWAADTLFQIVNARQGKLNVYTTNYSGKELKQKYGMLSSRIISRLMNGAKVIQLEGPDNRLKGLY